MIRSPGHMRSSTGVQSLPCILTSNIICAHEEADGRGPGAVTAHEFIYHHERFIDTKRRLGAHYQGLKWIAPVKGQVRDVVSVSLHKVQPPPCYSSYPPMSPYFGAPPCQRADNGCDIKPDELPALKLVLDEPATRCWHYHKSQPTLIIHHENTENR